LGSNKIFHLYDTPVISRKTRDRYKRDVEQYMRGKVMRKTETGFIWEQDHFFRRFPGFHAYPFLGVAVKWRLHISKVFVEDKN